VEVWLRGFAWLSARVVLACGAPLSVRALRVCCLAWVHRVAGSLAAALASVLRRAFPPVAAWLPALRLAFCPWGVSLRGAAGQPNIALQGTCRLVRAVHFILIRASWLCPPSVGGPPLSSTLCVKESILKIPSSRNPHKSSSVNPSKNSSVNPLKNSSISPLKNSSLNPSKNSSINPHKNSSINPFKNSSINPHKNSSLNPFKSSSINPFKSSSINPYKSSNIPGMYTFDLEGNVTGFTVNASEKVSLWYDMEGEPKYFTIKANEDVLIVCDFDGNWEHIWVSNGRDCFNQFDLDGNWLGFTT